MMLALRPHTIASYLATATAAATAATFDQTWSADANPLRPYKSTSTGAVITLTWGAAVSVDTFVIAGHNLGAPCTAVLSGGVSDSITIPAMRPGGIPYGYWRRLSAPVSVTSIVLTLAGNATDCVVGEFIVGLADSVDILLDQNELSDEHGEIDHDDDSDVTSVPNTDLMYERFGFSGSMLCNATQREYWRDWRSGSRGNSLPGVIIPDARDNQAYVVKLAPLTWHMETGEGNRLYTGNISLREIKRVRC